MNSIHDDDPSESNRDSILTSAIVPGMTLSSAIVPGMRPASVFAEQPANREPQVIRELSAAPPYEFPGENASDASAVDVSRFLHSLRRNWLLGTVLGILLAGPLAAAMWWLNALEFTATEFVRISPNHTHLVFETMDTTGRFDFKSFKNTQRQLLMQPLALSKAVKDSNVASLPFVRNHPDVIGWLQETLEVTFPDQAEIMNVSLKCADPVVAHRIVKAIVDTYNEDVVEKERTERLSRVERLEKILVEAEEKVRKKRGELKGLVEKLGTSDQGTLNLFQQSSLQQFSLLRSELSKINFEMMRAKGELQARNPEQTATADEAQNSKVKSDEKQPGAKQEAGAKSAVVSVPPKQDPAKPDTVKPATVKQDAVKQDAVKQDNVNQDAGNAIVKDSGSASSAAAEISDVVLEDALERDSTASKLTREVERLQTLIQQTGQRYDQKTAASYVKKYQVQLDEARQKLADRTKRIQRLLLEQPSTSAPGLVRSENLPLRIGVLEKQEEHLRAEMANLEAESKKFGRSSVDVEMTRKEIDDLDPVVSRVSQEIERTKIELNSASRITLYPSTGVPQIGSNKRRIPLTAVAGVFGLIGPLVLLMLRDFLRNHVNSAEMINRGMKISVLGSIPKVPSRVMMRLNDPSLKAAKQWRQRVSESVTAVTAMMLRKLEVDGHRVILVASAMPGEGKSTLAEQLARSLADSGHRTLLIDFDLRRPQLHRRFNIPLEPGVSDVLRQGVELKRTVRKTDTSNLHILTAGNVHGSLLLEAANGTLESLFKECRADYELVVVDSSPLLPVVDGRLVGQFTDGAIMTVLKDTSKVPQILAARNILSDYEIPMYGCVVTGDNSDEYYNSYGGMVEIQGSLARGANATRSMSAM